MGDTWPLLTEVAIAVLAFFGTLAFALLAIALLKDAGGRD